MTELRLRTILRLSMVILIIYFAQGQVLASADEGLALAGPTPASSEPATVCPDVCHPKKKLARNDCKGKKADGCSLQNCKTETGPGFSCSPIKCPEVCYPSRKEAKKSCKKGTFGICELKNCKDGSGGYICTKRTECPGKCYKKKSKAEKICAKIQFTVSGCEVKRCYRKKGGFSCGPPLLEEGTVMELQNPKVGEEFENKLIFTVPSNSPVSKEDFYLLSDATGSMGGQIEQVRQKMEQIIEQRSDTVDDVAFGVGFFRDEADGFDNGFNNLLPITKNTDSVTAAVKSLSAIDGGDAPEANLVALYKIATQDSIGWRKGTRKILVYFGDVAGHEPTCFSGNTIKRSDVIKALKEKGIIVVGVSYGSTAASLSSSGLSRSTYGFGCGTEPAESTGTGQGIEITTETDGIMMPSTDATTLIDSILSGVSTLPQTFFADSSDCDMFLSTAYDPSFPTPPIEPGESINIIQKFSIKPSACSSPDGFECNFKYSASGSELLPITIRTDNIIGC